MANLNIGNSSSSTVVGTNHNGNILPQTTTTYDLGSATLKGNAIYLSKSIYTTTSYGTTLPDNSAGVAGQVFFKLI